MSDNFYRAFEERYRGSRELIKGRLEAYTPFVAPLAALYPGAAALDLGCGRGEWLELMTENGFAASGVDLDEGMLAACRERGLNVETADALSSLRSHANASVALVSAFHLVEHLPFDEVQCLIAEARRVLLPGGLLIMETPNPENLVVGTSSFYLDPSHVKPIPPLLLDFMVEYAAFPRHAVVRLHGAELEQDQQELGLRDVFEKVSADYGIVAQKAGDQALTALFDAPFAAGYGVTLDEMAARFDHHQASLRAADREALAALQASVAGLSGPAGETGSVQAELAALRAHAQEQENLVAALAASLQSLSEQADQRLAAFEEANNELWKHALPSLVDRMQGIDMRIDELRTTSSQQVQTLELGLAQRIEQLDQRLNQHGEQIEQRIEQLDQRHERRVSAAEERRMHNNRLDSRRFDELEQRVARSDRRLASLPQQRLQDTERLLAQSREHLQQAEERVQQLEGQISAMLGSSSWRVTAPGRLVGGLVRRAVSAAREGRIRSGLRRRVATLVLGAPGADTTRGVRGWLRRTKNSTWARRIALPLLKRFPQLRAPLIRLMEGGSLHAAQPAGDVILPDWDGPLPAEYLQMTPLTRKILLDLARANSSNQ
ncbi:methyltransferase domain-containing protein [Massilia sp. YIM B02769]|uniref:class I SAM-dependent methyltransferase n=1 Tax=unclassified Massilia TaxID=2609279 RepID=UPI0025B6D8E5|nr:MULTISPECIES: methyltransferase domain-containing protein [unclassified Massilia]MDN4061348.1 methyltransferase domain-containing protein [Massilia sp. YIM B02769]